MTFDQMKTELFARGTNYLEESGAEVARAESWLNLAYRQIINLHPWQFLEVTKNDSASPINIPDLRRVVFVRMATSFQPLKFDRLMELVNDGYNLAQNGTPERYYFDTTTSIKTHPVSAELIEVRYVKRVPPLITGQSPIFGEEYHNIIVDKAMVKAYIDGDNFGAAQALKEDINETLAAMVEDYVLQSPEPSYIRLDPQDG